MPKIFIKLELSLAEAQILQTSSGDRIVNETVTYLRKTYKSFGGGCLFTTNPVIIEEIVDNGFTFVNVNYVPRWNDLVLPFQPFSVYYILFKDQEEYNLYRLLYDNKFTINIDKTQ